MAKLKAAKVRVAAYYIDCPDCGNGICAPDNGSFVWPIDMPIFNQETVKCDDCDGVFTLPKKLRDALIPSSPT